MAQKNYSGPDRRIAPFSDRRSFFPGNCLEHSGLVQRIENVEHKTENLENQGFLTLANYWWTTGILVSILVAVLSASIYTTFQASEALREVKAAQNTLIVQIDYLQDDIDELKQRNLKP